MQPEYYFDLNIRLFYDDCEATIGELAGKSYDEKELNSFYVKELDELLEKIAKENNLTVPEHSYGCEQWGFEVPNNLNFEYDRFYPEEECINEVDNLLKFVAAFNQKFKENEEYFWDLHFTILSKFFEGEK